MSAVHIEPAKVLAIALNNIAVAFAVIGFVAPITAMSSGTARADLAAGDSLPCSDLALRCDRLTLDRTARAAEHQAMSSRAIFVTVVIPAITLAVADAALRANESAIQRDEGVSGT